jgi:hypothetical protein
MDPSDPFKSDRGDLLKKAGVGALALGSIPIFADVARADDDSDDGRLRLYFVALSGQASAVNLGDSIAMSGCGSFGDGRVQGGGEFVHFDGTRFGNPNNVRATGSWRATRFLSFQEVGTWGVGVSGILRIEIRLIPCDHPAIRGATLEIVCNLGPAGIGTPGTVEGYTLTVPGLAPFKAFSPNIGLTLFTRPCHRNDDDDEEDHD